MTGDGTGVIGPRGLLAVLAGCMLAAAALAGPAAAQGPRPNPQELWRAYPLEQPSARAAAAQQPPRRTQPAKASSDGWPSPLVAAAAAATGALLAGGVLALMRLLRGRRAAPALRAPLPLPPGGGLPPSRSPPPRRPGPLAPETCWIVCWRASGRAAFYAIARDSDGRQQFIGESPAFTATPNSPLVLDDAAFEALQSLATRLSDGGWEPAAPVGARGARWHAQEFRRKTFATDRRHRRPDRGARPRTG